MFRRLRAFVSASPARATGILVLFVALAIGFISPYYQSLRTFITEQRDARTIEELNYDLKQLVVDEEFGNRTHLLFLSIGPVIEEIVAKEDICLKLGVEVNLHRFRENHKPHGGWNLDRKMEFGYVYSAILDAENFLGVYAVEIQSPTFRIQVEAGTILDLIEDAMKHATRLTLEVVPASDVVRVYRRLAIYGTSIIDGAIESIDEIINEGKKTERAYNNIWIRSQPFYEQMRNELTNDHPGSINDGKKQLVLQRGKTEPHLRPMSPLLALFSPSFISNLQTIDLGLGEFNSIRSSLVAKRNRLADISKLLQNVVVHGHVTLEQHLANIKALQNGAIAMLAPIQDFDYGYERIRKQAKTKDGTLQRKFLGAKKGQ